MQRANWWFSFDGVARTSTKAISVTTVKVNVSDPEIQYPTVHGGESLWHWLIDEVYSSTVFVDFSVAWRSRKTRELKTSRCRFKLHQSSFFFAWKKFVDKPVWTTDTGSSFWILIRQDYQARMIDMELSTLAMSSVWQQRSCYVMWGTRGESGIAGYWPVWSDGANSPITSHHEIFIAQTRCNADLWTKTSDPSRWICKWCQGV